MTSQSSAVTISSSSRTHNNVQPKKGGKKSQHGPKAQTMVRDTTTTPPTHYFEPYHFPTPAEAAVLLRTREVALTAGLSRQEVSSEPAAAASVACAATNLTGTLSDTSANPVVSTPVADEAQPSTIIPSGSKEESAPSLEPGFPEHPNTLSHVAGQISALHHKLTSPASAFSRLAK